MDQSLYIYGLGKEKDFIWIPDRHSQQSRELARLRSDTERIPEGKRVLEFMRFFHPWHAEDVR